MLFRGSEEGVESTGFSVCVQINMKRILMFDDSHLLRHIGKKVTS